METKAKLNYLRIAPRKVRLVADLLRGREVKAAELELLHLPKRVSTPLLKLLRSAVANAKHNFDLAADSLRIKSVIVDQGAPLKRYRPRAFGRSSPIRKETSHITLVLETTARVESAKTASGKKGKGGPAIREVRLEDLKEVAEKKNRTLEGGKEVKSKTKPVDFVRRMFRRKAI